MKTLITGATGFIGRHLIQDGCIAMVRKPSGFPEEVTADLLDKKSLVAACDGVEAIIHCAGFTKGTGQTNENLHWGINFQGTRNLLDAAQKAGVKKFVFLSTVKAMASPGSNCVTEDWPGEPNSHYGRAKRAAEKAVLDASRLGSMQITILRPAMVYGSGSRSNLERLAKGIQAGWFPILPDTKNQRSFLNIEDLIDAIWLVAKRPEANGKIYIVADTQCYSGRAVCEIIRSSLPQSKIFWNISERQLRYVGRLGDLLGHFLSRPFPINSEIVSRLIDSECYLPTLIQNELGWQPKINLQKGLKIFLARQIGDT